ncbi:MAG TPA: deoxyguanosinetriphosphate triphosphohydrolase [Candidatus Binatia bacterium]
MKREEYEAREDALLAPWAMRSAQSRGREFPEPEHPLRTAFQRDRDRIVHSTAFRRLEYKTQVFVNHEGDYYRTRLTHTMEGAQITRTMARALRLNEDLAEAVVLAHDLGHTPFGHAGERVLDALMKPYGGFEHNAQSLRIVERLEERYPDFPGLNLTWEVREGIVKHSSEYDRPMVKRFDPHLAPCLEAQIADFADEIAYNCHDIDDGLQSGMLHPEQMEQVTLWREHFAEARARWPKAPFSLLRYQTVRRILDAMVSDLVAHVERQLAQHGIKSIDDVRAVRPRLVDYSPEMAPKIRELKDFLMAHLYTHVRVTRMGVKAKTIITGLFNTYLDEPRQMPPHVYALIEKGEDRARVIADYIAGMTDRFALDEYKKLFDPLEKV